MSGHTSLDQQTLLELWALANEAEIASKGQSRALKNVYICTTSSKDKTVLHVKNQAGSSFARFFHWLKRWVNKKSFMIAPGSTCAQQLKLLHKKTADLNEAALIKAIVESSLCSDGTSAEDVLKKIKTGCRIVNLLLQHTMEHKLESSLENNQEDVKLFFTTLFLPSWGLTDARKAEIQRAADELKNAQAIAENKFLDVIEKIQAYLDAATAQLNVAMTGKEEAEELLSHAKASQSADTLQHSAMKAKDCANAADDAVSFVRDIVKQADELINALEREEGQSIINFSEIEKLKKFREIVNIVGQTAEYAQTAKNAASEVMKLARSAS